MGPIDGESIPPNRTADVCLELRSASQFRDSLQPRSVLWDWEVHCSLECAGHDESHENHRHGEDHSLRVHRDLPCPPVARPGEVRAGVGEHSSAQSPSTLLFGFPGLDRSDVRDTRKIRFPPCQVLEMQRGFRYRETSSACRTSVCTEELPLPNSH